MDNIEFAKRLEDLAAVYRENPEAEIVLPAHEEEIVEWRCGSILERSKPEAHAEAERKTGEYAASGVDRVLAIVDPEGEV